MVSFLYSKCDKYYLKERETYQLQLHESIIDISIYIYSTNIHAEIHHGYAYDIYVHIIYTSIMGLADVMF